MNDATSAAVSRPLLITGRPYPGMDWADVVSTASAGLVLWRERHHSVVFADFGDLGGGLTGVWLARALRVESAQVRIFLLSDSADASQKSWARANGAHDVVSRHAESIAACLSGLHHSTEETVGTRLVEAWRRTRRQARWSVASAGLAGV